MGSKRKRILISQENKYISIDREMSKAFREYDDLAIPTVRDYRAGLAGVSQAPHESIPPVREYELLPIANADVPAEYTLVPGKYTAFRQEYLKEVTARLEAANKRRERKMGGRK